LDVDALAAGSQLRVRFEEAVSAGRRRQCGFRQFKEAMEQGRAGAVVAPITSIVSILPSGA